MCNSREEDETHLFMRCSTALEVMARLKSWWGLLPNLMQISNVDDLVMGHRGTAADRYEVVVHAFMWVLWLHRNELIFKGQVKGMAQLVSEVRALSFEWYKNRGKCHSSIDYNNWAATSHLNSITHIGVGMAPAHLSLDYAAAHTTVSGKGGLRNIVAVPQKDVV
ncbi:hypothetical protein LXL04_032375 [Taraxacum kok-saghyz]